MLGAIQELKAMMETPKGKEKGKAAATKPAKAP
jgi:hypothetical protein